MEFLHIQLQDNSQMYEQWLGLKHEHEEDRKIQSSLTHKLGTVPSLFHVVCYLLIIMVYFMFQWVSFSLLDPHSSWWCSSPD